jgi:hypothetical protein
MDLDEIKAKVQSGEFFLSAHADTERNNDNLEVEQVRTALLDGKILEQYEDAGRGVSCLIVGFAGEQPIHIVCGWANDHRLIIITVYIPKPPHFTDPFTRGE